jgi:hypothetical protein
MICLLFQFCKVHNLNFHYKRCKNTKKLIYASVIWDEPLKKV